MNAILFEVNPEHKVSVLRTAWVADLNRRSVMAQYGRLYSGTASETLSGKNKSGVPLVGHRHAYYLPLDNDCDGFVDLLAICSSTGFSQEELTACQAVQTLSPGHSNPAIGVSWQGEGGHDDFPGIMALQSESSWCSATPFVLGRFPKVYRSGKRKVNEQGIQIDGQEDQLRREWDLRRSLNQDLPEIEKVSFLPACELKGRSIPWERFEQRRRKASPGLAVGFCIQFSSPVAGPLALGQGAHFGLGMFKPVLPNDG